MRRAGDLSLNLNLGESFMKLTTNILLRRKKAEEFFLRTIFSDLGFCKENFKLT